MKIIVQLNFSHSDRETTGNRTVNFSIDTNQKICVIVNVLNYAFYCIISLD